MFFYVDTGPRYENQFFDLFFEQRLDKQHINFPNSVRYVQHVHNDPSTGLSLYAAFQIGE